MNDEPQNLVRADKVDGRGIMAVCNHGRWRWQVETRGPFVQGVHMQVWRLAGDALESARQLAHDLGPMTESDENRTFLDSN
jgi:hypothetical protein